MKYRLAIFDMDGTILDTLEDLKDSTNYVLRQFKMPERSLEEIRNFVGNGIRTLLERAAVSGTSSTTVDEMFRVFSVYYKDHSAIKTKPYDGIVACIQKLREAGVKTAVVSNKADFAVQILCKDYFDGLFDISVGERENLQRKPAPDSVNLVLNILGISKEDAVYIGDSEVDLQTARNSNMDVIPVSWGFRNREFLKQQGAAFVIDKPDEILHLILE